MEKLYSTNRQIVWAAAWMAVSIAFLIVGISISFETFRRMAWPSANGVVISCVQHDEFVKRYKSPGQRLYFERRTVENVSYRFEVRDRVYTGTWKESLKADRNWVNGATREIISESSKTPILIWYDPQNPNRNSIRKTGLTDLPWWPWLLVIVAIGGALCQLQDRKDAMRINKDLPKALQKAQLEAFKRKLRRR